MGTLKPNTTKARHYQYEKQQKQFALSMTPVVIDRLTLPPKCTTDGRTTVYTGGISARLAISHFSYISNSTIIGEIIKNK